MELRVDLEFANYDRYFTEIERLKVKMIRGLVAVLFVALTTACFSAESDVDAADPPVTFPGFSWQRVPLNIHFAKRSAAMTDREIGFIADHSDFICLEKSHGARVHGSTRMRTLYVTK